MPRRETYASETGTGTGPLLHIDATLHYIAAQYSTVQYSTVQYSTVQRLKVHNIKSKS